MLSNSSIQSIGYFLIDSLNGIERRNLLETAITLVNETSAHLQFDTFDGTYMNTAMCTSLGANFGIGDNALYFVNKAKKKKCFVSMTRPI